METPSNQRLNKRLALLLGVSRREADALIATGKVSVNGQVATIGNRVTDTDTLALNGKSLSSSVSYVYLVLNKPVGYVCSRRPQGDTPTIYSLLPDIYLALKPVGRLDKDSSGLILLTNDGDFAYKMTHPSFHKNKSYEVSLDIPLEPLHQQMVSDFGVTLPDGVSKLTLTRLKEGDSYHWQVTMHEGRNRQIRRTFAALGYEVVKLHRTQFGNYSLGDIKPGEYKITDIS